MGRKAQIGIIVVVLLLVGGAVGAYAYDNSRKNQVADGITVGGVEIGGLSRAEATALLHRRLVKPLSKPLTVSFDGQTYTLPGAKLKIHANINGMVDRALDASRRRRPAGPPRPLRHRRLGRQADPAGGHLLAAGDQPVRAQGRLEDRPRSAERLGQPQRRLAERGPREGGAQGARRRADRRAEPRGHRRQRLANDQGRGPFDQAGGGHQQGGLPVPDLPDPGSCQLHPALLAEPEARQELHRRRRAAGPGDARRPLPHPGQAGEPLLARAELAPGRGASPDR